MGDRLIRALGYLGGFAIAAMMVLIVGEVLSRALLGQSIPGALEIVGIFLSLAVFLGFAPSEQAHQHVRVELLRDRLGPARRSTLDLLGSLAGFVVVAVVTWAVGVDAYSSFAIREVLPGAAWEVPVYPAKIGAFIGFLAFGLQLLRNTVARVRSGAADSGDGEVG
jgi:TRAP-type C4-dicarboxylate transport system permease small subunit